MLQPKKPNPNQKTKRITPQTQYESQIDWDKVRSVNDNMAVQAAKMFDPTGVTSYPDVYYAGKDLYEGKGSVGNLALNILGALPVIGEVGRVANASSKISKVLNKVSRAEKVLDKAEKVAPKIAKVVGNVGETISKVSRGGKANPIGIAAKVVGKVGKGVVKADEVTRRVLGREVSKLSSSAEAGQVTDIVTKLLNVSNTTSDINSIVNSSNSETPSPIDKKKIIQYYNTDPKRGKVEKPGQLTDVQYVPVSNSAELKMWEQQQLAFGTNQDGIMKKGMNPRKKYAAGTSAITPNGIPSPATTLNDYQIMMAKAEEEAASNAWLPVVATVGGLAQSAIGLLEPGAKDANAVKAANGMNNVNADVEVEGGEMYETPQGDTGEFQGPSHEQGGIPMEVNQDIPEGTKVYSDRLKVGKETLAERKAKRERQIANLEKIASQPLVDSAVKNATKRKMEAIQKEEMADLQFQEQVNNMQAMADSVVKAFGTSMAGVEANPVGASMRYGCGTGVDGVTKYEDGTDLFGVKKKFPKLNLEEPSIEGMVTNGMKSFEPTDPFALTSADSFAKANPLPAGVFENSIGYTPNLVPEGTETMVPVNPSGTKLSRAMGKLEGMPGIEDLTSLFGNYLGATAGLKNAAEQRSTDVTHQNVFANAGKDSQKYLEQSIGNVTAMKNQAEMKATTGARTSKASARGGARGINQKRGMDWLYDQGLADSIASISAGAASQIAAIRDKQSGVALSADQLKGEGQLKAEMANEAAKDAYYTAMGLGLKDQALGVQQTGKDLNAMKQNKIIENLMKQYGTYVMANSKGELVNKPKK